MITASFNKQDVNNVNRQFTCKVINSNRLLTTTTGVLNLNKSVIIRTL